MKGLQTRGIFICALLVPLCLYSSYLGWSVYNNKGESGWPSLFAYFGSFFVSFIGGLSLGLLLVF